MRAILTTSKSWGRVRTSVNISDTIRVLSSGRSPWDILGIPPGSDEDTVKKAYRKLAMKYHPDKNPGDQQAAQRFREVTQAYNDAKAGGRNSWNPGGSSGFPGGGGSGFQGRPFTNQDAERVFQEFFRDFQQFEKHAKAQGFQFHQFHMGGMPRNAGGFAQQPAQQHAEVIQRNGEAVLRTTTIIKQADGTTKKHVAEQKLPPGVFDGHEGPINEEALRKAGVNMGKTILKEVGKALAMGAVRGVGNAVKSGVNSMASSMLGLFKGVGKKGKG